ncbi:3196_t:CDS:1, partial [Entrophospora sp. SA101]
KSHRSKRKEKSETDESSFSVNGNTPLDYGNASSSTKERNR